METEVWFELFTLGRKLEGVPLPHVSTIMKLLLIPCTDADVITAFSEIDGSHLNETTLFDSTQVASIYKHLHSQVRKIEINELADCLRLIEARRSVKGEDKRNSISVSEFVILTKVLNKASLSRCEVDEVFGSDESKNIDDLAFEMICLLN